LKLCRSSGELRGGKYEVTVSRQVELEPRAFLGCNNKARSAGIAVKDLVKRDSAAVVGERGRGAVEERIIREAQEEKLKVALRWKDWRENKWWRERAAIRQKFREIKEAYQMRV